MYHHLNIAVMPLTWADQPFALIDTRQFSQDSSHAAYYVATQMSLAHNGIIRGLNSIYLQAPNLPAGDTTVARDFLIYCQCWSESMHHHHDAEEAIFFPEIESITKIKGLMEQNVEQHRAFTPGFDEFYEYSKTCQPVEYDGRKMKALVEAFAKPLIKHLHDEIETLRALDKYNSEKIRRAYRRFEKSLMATDNVKCLPSKLDIILLTPYQYRIAPLVFGTADRSFEGGIHDFPAVPFFVPYVINYIFGMRYHSVWRFNPCTSWRDRRELPYA
ncbi:hypothetical protein E4T43_06968 [Aureobasidium subglaciale]|nr:hypothetical protein E4T43_06968 [Aureobasidium subglaciale]